MKPRRPYLLRALYEWIVDCGEIPNILVDTEVDGVMVPTEYVEDGQIVFVENVQHNLAVIEHNEGTNKKTRISKL